MEDEDIEILDLDEEIIYTKKEVRVESVYEEHIPVKKVKEIANVAVRVSNPEKTKQKKKMGVFQKSFLIVSILFIIGCFIFYGYRTYHYYHVTHDVVKNITLKEKLTALKNISYQNDGLYEKSGYFYYKGIDVNNYVYYSGRLWRIIDIDNGIRMIEDDTSTNLVWTFDSNFEDSYINSWLNNYLKTLKDYDIYLVKNKWCNDVVDLENYKCDETIEDYVGLLSTSDYLQAGGKNSYLNNETYFWTINQDQDGNVFYVNNEGSINNISRKDEVYFSYGIRPVITIKDDLSIISGDGSEDDPFILEELGNALLKDNAIGSYVKYNKDTYRIISVDDEGVSLLYDGVLDISKKYSDVSKYLNNDFLKKFDKKELVKNDYFVNEYSYSNKYVLDNKNKKSNYVTIPSIGELFLGEYNGYWLNDYSDSKLGLYYMIDENNMFFSDLSGNAHKIRPIIKLNIDTVVNSGTGMQDDPLLIGEEGEEDVEKN